ncbi:MAG: 50S ribosomal protein L21 [Candidatus Lloydbacteria bacterium CG22_combo_CG10-13_8_21_14_all_47_15]|uniref:Large ribosomal subunit protein bL21 n=1 Tax=Candidatus Lloydbacteria bacterium CG22_combo_CG10-13_8_21_14_all_47_15 TaxID=1974635 RepID=A0A2H0CTD0_9BACT|nr:MAG: 50S ribosomal protein L21 [Candidatus Lloydbacteria bacterium CG22_combo_CG10-13_8_21_14_all_47_15]
MAFAIIETGGKQYRVKEGDSITIEKLAGDAKEGDAVTFDKVLVLDDGKETKIGTPYLDGVKIEAVFQKTGKGKKVTVIRFRAKSRYHKKKGHRQPYSKVSISKVA